MKEEELTLLQKYLVDAMNKFIFAIKSMVYLVK